MTDTAICAYCRDVIHLEEEIFVIVSEGEEREAAETRYAHAECDPNPRRLTAAAAVPAVAGARSGESPARLPGDHGAHRVAAESTPGRSG